MEHGYKLVKNFADSDLVTSLEQVLLHHHNHWIEQNKDFYQEKAINSAYITRKNNLSDEDRMILFSFIASKLIQQELDLIFPANDACFMNTQLFFNPYNIEQKNYWHRDIQYTGLSFDDQKKAVELDSNNVVHFRLALRDENGIELIPGTNRRWDTEVEYKTRMNIGRSKAYQDLEGSEKIPLQRGDLLIFSANMIHRGLYGKDRMAFDMLFCKPDPQLLRFRDETCLPDRIQLQRLDNPGLFF